MRQIELTGSQKGVVRRYVEMWRRWRPGIRSFAELERDIEKGSKVLVDGITVDDRAELPVIVADAGDHKFYAAIFDDDDDAVDDMTEELDQLRRYVLFGNGIVLVRKWRRPRSTIGAAVVGVPFAAQASHAQDRIREDGTGRPCAVSLHACAPSVQEQGRATVAGA